MKAIQIITPRSVLLLILLVGTTLSTFTLQATITAPSKMKMYSTNNISWSAGPSQPGWTFVSWSTTAPQLANIEHSFGSMASNSTNMDIGAIAVGSFKLVANLIETVVDNNNNTTYVQHTEEKVILVSPTLHKWTAGIWQPISGPIDYYIGQPAAVLVRMLDPDAWRQGTYLWSSTPLSACSACGNNQDNVAIVAPNPIPASLHASGIVYLSCQKGCWINSSYENFTDGPVQVRLKLSTPVIGGQISVGCDGNPTNSLVYSVVNTIIGADPNAYDWQIPPGWSFIGSSNTSQITVNTNGTSGGPIKVRAHAAPNSLIFSALAEKNVNCCVSNTIVTLTLNSGAVHNVEAATSIQALNTINSNATASYHAGTNVRISPNFHAQAGSNFHGYIEGCTNSFESANAYLKISSLEEETPLENPYLSLMTSVSEPQPMAQESQNKFIISPNPNDRRFKLIFDKNVRGGSVRVLNVLGKEVFKVNLPNDKSIHELEIENQIPNGTYYVLWSNEHYVCTQKMIIN